MAPGLDWEQRSPIWMLEVGSLPLTERQLPSVGDSLV